MYKVNHIHNLNNEKNTYTFGCIVSQISLYASNDAESNVCIIKKTKKQNCRFTHTCTCTEVDTGVSA